MTDTVCYRFDLMNLSEEGVFDRYVDMVYLLTLEGSPRTEVAIERVKESGITSRLTVQYNKGYKCSHKKLPERVSYADITHALGNIFRHAKSHRYKNILVLEDDFIFDPEYYTRDDLEEIGQFVANNEIQIYNLGAMPLISFPVLPSGKHRRTLVAPPAHSVIYNETYFPHFHMEAKSADNLVHCDSIPDFRFDLKSYAYHKAVCFQIFPLTENQQHWFMSGLCTYLIGLAGIDKSHKNYQFYSILLTYISDIITLILIWFIIRYIIELYSTL